MESWVSAGGEALNAGEWTVARGAFEAALEQEESAEALAGLGDALWWLGETDDAVEHIERAYAAFRRRPDPAQAAAAAVGLYFLNRISLGNRAIARGWLSEVTNLRRDQSQSGRPDLNRGPHRPERCALPGCATPRGAEG